MDDNDTVGVPSVHSRGVRTPEERSGQGCVSRQGTPPFKGVSRHGDDNLPPPPDSTVGVREGVVPGVEDM